MKKFLIKLIKQGKLKLVEPSEEIFNSYFDKSLSNFESSNILFGLGKLEEVISLSYYSMYNLVLALLFKIGIKCENHSASIYLLNELFDFNNKDILIAKKERIDKQYYVGFKILKKEVEESLMITENFNRDLKGFISTIGKNDIIKYRKMFEELLK